MEVILIVGDQETGKTFLGKRLTQVEVKEGIRPWQWRDSERLLIDGDIEFANRFILHGKFYYRRNNYVSFVSLHHKTIVVTCQPYETSQIRFAVNKTIYLCNLLSQNISMP